jgi:hypothetical protein
MDYLGPIITTLSAIFFALNEPWNIRRFWRFNYKPANIGISLIIIGCLISFITTYNSDLEKKKLTNELNDVKNEIIVSRNKAEDAESKLFEAQKELIEGKDTLLYQSRENRTGIDRMIYQNIELRKEVSTYQKQVQEKDKEIKTLRKETKNAKYGVEVNYHYDGSVSPTGVGIGMVATGGVYDLYQKIIALETENTMLSWLQIKDICDKQIDKIPGWYTLNIYRGKAHSFLGSKESAKKEYDYVIENAEDDSDFSKEAQRLLDDL